MPQLPPPHFGGIWERLVQIFKLSLYKVIGSRTLTDEILNTVACEIEASMNSRPLTNVPYDINDPLPLTPNHFLLGRSSVNLSPCVFIGKEKNLSKSWRSSQQIATHFWNRFLREYLPTQQVRCKWHKTSKNLQVDDLVWILEDFTPRGIWLELFKFSLAQMGLSDQLSWRRLSENALDPLWNWAKFSQNETQISA